MKKEEENGCVSLQDFYLLDGYVYTSAQWFATGISQDLLPHESLYNDYLSVKTHFGCQTVNFQPQLLFLLVIEPVTRFYHSTFGLWQSMHAFVNP